MWAAYAVSTFGTRFALNAFTLIAIVALEAGPAEVSLLAAAGLVAGAVVALPLGPWVEFRRKRPVMIGMDLIRFAAMLSVPAAYLAGRLSFAQLLVVSVVSAAADITFQAASGAYLKALLPPADLLVANGRFESTNWTATVLGPPLGAAAIGWFGPVAAVLGNAAGYLLSALGIRAIGGGEPPPARTGGPPRGRDLVEGWRFILTHLKLRRLFVDTVLVNGLILAPQPVLAVLMLGELGFAPWQYSLAFAVPCVGGLLGSRLSRRLVARFGHDRVLRTAGLLRVCWPVGLAFVHPGPTGLLLVIVVELGLITSMGVFNPVFATYRLGQVPADRVMRTLSAWSVTAKITTAALTALWGALAAATGPRTALALAGLLILATPAIARRAARHRPRAPRSSCPAGRIRR
ncbi:MFS transporter [Amycolatopsis magusensis]